MIRAPFSICLFGSHLIRQHGRPYRLGIRGMTLELLRYLVVHANTEIRREFLADQFWRRSSERQQRSALSSAIWRIGKKLPAHSSVNLQVTGSTLCLQIDESLIDSKVLTRIVQQGACDCGMNDSLAGQLFAALQASQEPFLNGTPGDWALAEKERIFNIRMRGMTILMHWYGDNGRYEDALEIGRRLLTEDPFRETAQIDVMWLYVMNGQRAQAIRQYDQYVELLARELDIEPMPETKALYDHIRCALDRRPTNLPDRTAQSALQHERLDKILAATDRSRRELYRALRSQFS